MKTRTTKEVERLLKDNQTLNMIDVRGVEEVAQGKIPGVMNIPLGLLEFRMHELDKSKEYTIVCRSGARSGRAAQYLSERGYNVVNMAGGMIDWHGEVV